MDHNHRLINNKHEQQFEYHIDNTIAKIDYKLVEETIYLTHIEVPSMFEGQGIGSALVKDVLEYIDDKELSLVPLCPFVASYLEKHPEWARLVKKGDK